MLVSALVAEARTATKNDHKKESETEATRTKSRYMDSRPSPDKEQVKDESSSLHVGEADETIQLH